MTEISSLLVHAAEWRLHLFIIFTHVGGVLVNSSVCPYV